MDPRQRERTKKIFELLQDNTNTRKQSGISSPAPNDRRPSRPRPYDEHNFTLRKRVSKRAKSQTHERPVLPQKRQKNKFVVSPAKQSKSLERNIKRPETPDILNIDGIDFDDDDSVCDKTYDPMISGDLSSSDTENELTNRLRRVKKQLFTTPGKKVAKKVQIPRECLITVEAVIENVKSPNCKSVQDKQSNNFNKKQKENNSLITPDDLGLIEHGYSKINDIIDYDLITDEKQIETVNKKKVAEGDTQFLSHKDISQAGTGRFVDQNVIHVHENLDVPMELSDANISYLDSDSKISSISIPIKPDCQNLKIPIQLQNQNLTESLQNPEIVTKPIDIQNPSGEQAPEDVSFQNSIQFYGQYLPEDEVQIQIDENDMISPQMNRTRPVEHSSKKKNPRKRVRNVANWNKTVVKTKRLQGLSYTSITKNKSEIRARELKPPCGENCRKKCQDKLTEEKRRNLFNQFWINSNSWDQRRQYIANNIDVSIKKYMKTTSKIENDRRKFTHTYTIPMNTENITVCKTMFLNTFDISEKFVRVCLAKKLDSGLILPDQRGRHIPSTKTPEHVIESVVKHISSYPSYQSHYNRENTNRKYLGPELNICTMYKQYMEMMKGQNAEDIAKIWLYRHIFNTKFNLSFKLLEMDTCDDCDRFQRNILDANSEEEKQIIVSEKNIHLDEAERRYNLKKTDKEDCYQNNNMRVLFLDLQKCLPTPYLTNTQSFYLRKLWTLNLTIYEASEKKSSNYVWPETTAGRGGNEISSCLIKWAEVNLSDETITEIVTWTDNCQGQNRNMMLVVTYLWLMEKYPQLKNIRHKFLLKGHTHMEVDHVHSIIERKKKRLNTMEIAIPRDWAQFLRSCSGKNDFQVTEMNQDDFKESSALIKKSSGPFVLRKKNSMQEDFKISQTVMWKFERNKPGILFYKTNFEQTDFKELNLIRKPGKPFKCPDNLPNVRVTEKPIATSKYKDLMTLLQWIPKEFHTYYKNLKHSDTASDLPE